MAIAWAVTAAFQAAPPPAGALPLTFDFAIDRRVLLFSLLLSCATGILFGIAPALEASRPGLVPALKGTDATLGERRARFDLKKLLVVGEVALSLLLLIAAGLFVRGLQSARAIEPGVDVDKLVSAPLSVNLLRYTRAQGREFYRQAVERVSAAPRRRVRDGRPRGGARRQLPRATASTSKGGARRTSARRARAGDRSPTTRGSSTRTWSDRSSSRRSASRW